MGLFAKIPATANLGGDDFQPPLFIRSSGRRHDARENGARIVTDRIKLRDHTPSDLDRLGGAVEEELFGRGVKFGPDGFRVVSWVDLPGDLDSIDDVVDGLVLKIGANTNSR